VYEGILLLKFNSRVVGSWRRLVIEHGWTASSVARLYKVKVGDVREALKPRPVPPRFTLPRFVPPPVSIPPGWSYRTRPGDIPKTEPSPPIVEPVDCDPKVYVPASITPWVGPCTFSAAPGGKPKLSEQQAIEVRRERASGASMYELARRWKVARNTIYAIVNGKTWPDRSCSSPPPNDAPPSPAPAIGMDNETARTE
jgi:hypothetical protein